MTRPKQILVVEDDEALMLGLEENLRIAGYEVLTAGDGNQGLKLALDRKPDLAILDIMLPGMSGYEVCKAIRERKLVMPVIMLTARSEEFDKLLGFDVGADDYVTKPFSIKELLARVKAFLRREETALERQEKYVFDEYALDLNSRVLTCKGREIRLTRTEFELLAYFVANRGKALTREELMRDVWGVKYCGMQRSLDSFVASLRSKLEKDPARPTLILTVHGLGYKFAGTVKGSGASK